MTQLPDTTTEAGQREASVMLARLMGWHIGNKETTERGAWIRVLCDDKGNDLGLRPPFGGGIAPKRQELVPNSFFNLYRPANMALAWRVLNFAAENVPYFSKWWHDIAVVTIQDLPPAALSIFLCDNILRLADEAGMIEVRE